MTRRTPREDPATQPAGLGPGRNNCAVLQMVGLGIPGFRVGSGSEARLEKAISTALGFADPVACAMRGKRNAHSKLGVYVATWLIVLCSRNGSGYRVREQEVQRHRLRRRGSRGTVPYLASLIARKASIPAFVSHGSVATLYSARGRGSASDCLGEYRQTFDQGGERTREGQRPGTTRKRGAPKHQELANKD